MTARPSLTRLLMRSLWSSADLEGTVELLNTRIPTMMYKIKSTRRATANGPTRVGSNKAGCRKHLEISNAILTSLSVSRYQLAVIGILRKTRTRPAKEGCHTSLEVA